MNTIWKFIIYAAWVLIIITAFIKAINWVLMPDNIANKIGVGVIVLDIFFFGLLLKSIGAEFNKNTK